MTTVHSGQAVTRRHTHIAGTVLPHSRQSRATDRSVMSLSTLPARTSARVPLDAPVLDVVVPVHNEEIDLEPGVRRLHAYLAANFPYPFRITIADNASTDSTAGG